ANLESKYFKFDILVEPKWFKDVVKEEASNKMFEEALKVASHVLHGYRFEDFDHIEILSQFDGKTLKVSRDGLEEFRKKKMSFKDILTGSQNG
ncbi:MAG: hypothetical protein Q8R14_00585, partial [Candidatus Omnitrophota bacterium]|nr:hypothetical protein [Candidatus Omnitrophota bacterium]